MNLKYKFSLIAVILLFLLAYVSVEAAGLHKVFGIFIPYLAILIFTVGFICRVVGWARSYVPFRIPTTCGQQKTLSWIKPNSIDNPSTATGVFIRMVLEVLLFRSLFRNTKASLDKEGAKLSYKLEIWLWLAGLAFHYSFLVVVVRHLRLFSEPVPLPIQLLEKLDGFLQIGLPGIFISGFVLFGAVAYLFIRRIIIPQVRYVSQEADFFPLFLILVIAGTGIFMRYVGKVDIVGIKGFLMGLVSFHPSVPQDVSSVFYVHLFFVSLLLIYFPMSKLMHMGGIFLSPTRNMANNTRIKRHVNPWNYPVKVHTYEEYEDDFREKMIEAGLPVDKE